MEGMRRLTNDTLPETLQQTTLKNHQLEDTFPFGARPIFRGDLLVSGRVFTQKNRQV